MKVLLDTDAFCKLACSGLLIPALKVLGASPADARRLPALQHMLTRGRLATRLGQTRAAAALGHAATIPVIPDPDPKWLQVILEAGVEIDPGEAQLLAIAAADAGVLLVTGDKRALRELKGIPALAQAVAGRVVTVEAILLALCESIGEPAVRTAVASIHDLDTTIKACFASSDSKNGLQSYQKHLTGEVTPGLLWTPP